jgi:hypothetical protein
MKPRYSPRRPIQATTSFSCNGRVDYGYIEDLSIPGCRILTAAPLQVGDSLNLMFRILRHELSLRAPLAVVRWVRPPFAGLEFIGMSPADQRLLCQLVGEGEHLGHVMPRLSERRVATRLSRLNHKCSDPRDV